MNSRSGSPVQGMPGGVALTGAYVFPGGFDGIGGAESQALAALRHFNQKRLRVDLILLGPNRPFEEEAARIECLRTIRTTDRILDPWHPHSILRISRILRGGGYDFVHLYGLRQEIVSRPIAKFFGGAKVVSAIRGMESHRSRLHGILNRMTGNCVDLWISNSRQAKELFEKRDGLPENRIIVVPNGVEIPPPDDAQGQMRINARNLIGLKGNSFVVGCVANHLKSKRQEDLLDAAHLVLGNSVDVQVVLIGRTGEYTRTLRNKIMEKGLERNVQILGYRSDVRQILYGFDVIVLPSEKEGFPASILEGMAAGLPSVVTPVAGLLDLVIDGESGFYVPLRSPKILAEKLLWLHDNPDSAKKMGLKGRAFVEENYSIEILVQRLEKVYMGLVLGQGGSRS